MDKLHLNQLQPVSCPCIQASFSTKNHENRAKNGKVFTVEFAQKASQPLKFSPYFNHRAAAQKKKFIFGLFYHNMTSCSQASFPAIQLENGQQNGKFFTVASAPFFCKRSPPPHYCTIVCGTHDREKNCVSLARTSSI
jgi:hypothetical protein